MLGIANGLAYLHNFKPGIFLEHLCPVCKILVSFHSQLTVHHANVEDNFREWRRSSTNLCIFKYDVWTAGILPVLGHSSSWDGELPLRWCPCQSIWWGLRLCNGMPRGKWLNTLTRLLTTSDNTHLFIIDFHSEQSPPSRRRNAPTFLSFFNIRSHRWCLEPHSEMLTPQSYCSSYNEYCS